MKCKYCLDLIKDHGDDYKYYCSVHNREVFDPSAAGCSDTDKKLALERKVRKKQMYEDEEIGLWY